jgi:hypothetical protein
MFLNEKFHELVDRIAIQHICTRPQVLEIVSKWFAIHNNEKGYLKDALEMYGGLRDLGYSHVELLHAIKYIHALEFLKGLKNKPKEFCKLPESRLIRDD